MVKQFRFGIQVGGSHTGESLATLARRAEELGYSTMYFPDHFIDTEMAPMVAMAAVASTTSTLRTGALVFDNDYKHPAILAKEIATIDVLSGGRTELGIGAGWMEVDYTALGLPYDRPGVRIARLEEALQVIKGCYGAEAFSFSGEHYTVTEYQAIPKPTQTKIPILIGGGGPKVLRLAGREADIVGINPNLRAGAVTADAVTDSLAAMTDQKVAWIKEGAGSRFDDLELQIRYFLASITDDRDSFASTVAPGFGISAEDALEAGLALIGSADEVCDLMETRRDRWGVSYAVVGADEMEMFAPVVERLAGKSHAHLAGPARGAQPGPDALGRGLRALLAGPPLFAFGVGVLHNDTFAVTAVFAAISALVFADFGGSRTARVEAYAALGGVGAVLLAIGTAVAPSKLASVIVTFVVVVSIRFAGNLGPRFAAAVSPLILGLMLGLLVPAPDSAIPDRMIGWLVAIAVAALTSVTVFTSRDTTNIPDVAATAANRLAEALRTAVGSVDAESRAAAREDVHATLESVRAVALVPTRPSGPGAHDVARRQILDRLTRLARVLDVTLAASVTVELSDEMQEFGRAAAAVLDACAGGLEDPDAVHRVDATMTTLDAARRAAYARLEELATDEQGASGLVDRVDAGFVARAGAVHAETIAAQVAFLAGTSLTDDPADDARTDGLGARVARFASAYAQPSSVWFRDAFRAGLALTIAVVVAQAMNLDHAFWVALGTLSVLRGTALATGQDAVRAAWGTGLGVGVSSLVLALVGLHEGWLWVGMIVCTFLLAYLPVVAGFAWGQAAFTVFVVMLFNIVEPTGWHTGLVRIENVGLGVVVSTTVALLFWPRRVEPLLARLLAQTSAGAGALFATAIETGRDDTDYAAARTAVIVDEARTRAALVELMIQRRSRPQNTTPWLERLSVASHTRSAADAVIRIDRLVGDTPVPEPFHGALCAAAENVGAAVAPGRGSRTPAVAPDVDGTTRRAAERTLQDPQAARAGIVRGLLVRDWVLAVASQCDSRP